TTPQWTARAWQQVSAIRDHLGLADRIALAHFDGPHEIHGIETFDFLDRFLRPERPVGRDYEYSLGGGAYDWSTSTPLKREPFVTAVLDASEKSRLEGRCWMPAGAKTVRGLAVKLS